MLLLATLACVVPLWAQTSVKPAPEAPTATPEQLEAAGLANGWLLLARGRTADAATAAAALLAKYPRSAASLTFAVEAEIARGGWVAGLDQYERWLGGRFEQVVVVRRVARALLREISEQPQNPTARLESLKALAEDGDSLAIDTLRKAAGTGGYPEARALAAQGDAGGVGILIAGMNAGALDNLEAIRALGSSRSALAAPALLAQLDSPKPEVRGAAADALGHIGGQDVVSRLQAVLRDESTGYVRGRAAAALYRLGDDSGVAILRNLATAASSIGRLVAAEALSPRPDSSWGPLVESLLTADEPDVKLAAANLYLRVDPGRARDVLEELSRSPNAAIREQAGLALGAASANDVPALRRLLRSADRLTRVGAARAILALSR